MNSPIKYVLSCVLDILLPRRCLVCDCRLLVNEKHLCLHCMADLPLTYFWTYRHNAMADRLNALIEQKHPDNPHERYLDAAALFFYSHETEYREILYSLKYHYNIPAGEFFGKILGKRLYQSETYRDVDIVIPVPLHWRRSWSRGYNQAEVIAKAVAKELKAELRTDILKRKRHTSTQTKLDIEGKAANVEGAFKVKSSTLPGSIHEGPGEVHHILLVDDVFTTGSTLMACLTALRSVFPPSVRISVATLGFVGGT